MKPETKLWLRRRLLMMLRAIVWHADEWLHRQELQLREECAATKALVTPTRGRGDMAEVFGVGRVPPQRRIETFQQWEARRSGVAPVAKKSRRRVRALLEARHKNGLSAADFDLRCAR